MALERPAMTYLRAQLADRLQRQLARAYRRWLRPTSGRRPATTSCSRGHRQTAAVSTVDGAVRTPGRGSAMLPDTGHCRSRPDSRSRTWPPLLFRTGGWVSLLGGRRSCPSHLKVAMTCGSSGLEHRVRPHAAQFAMSTVATARAATCPRWRLASGRRPDTSSGAAGPQQHEPRRLLNGRGLVDPVGCADPVVRAAGCRSADSRHELSVLMILSPGRSLT
jgi:hypothetical protein